MELVKNRKNTMVSIIMTQEEIDKLLKILSDIQGVYDALEIDSEEDDIMLKTIYFGSKK